MYLLSNLLQGLFFEYFLLSPVSFLDRGSFLRLLKYCITPLKLCNAQRKLNVGFSCHAIFSTYYISSYFLAENVCIEYKSIKLLYKSKLYYYFFFSIVVLNPRLNKAQIRMKVSTSTNVDLN